MYRLHIKTSEKNILKTGKVCFNDLASRITFKNSKANIILQQSNFAKTQISPMQYNNPLQMIKYSDIPVGQCYKLIIGKSDTD